MERNDGDKPSGSSSPCRELRKLLEREIVTQYHGGRAPQTLAQPSGMEKNEDDKATGPSSPCYGIDEILAAETLCAMAQGRPVTPCFGGRAPQNLAQPSGMEKNEDDKATGSSSPCYGIDEILAAETLCAMAQGRPVTPCFGGRAPQNPAQAGGGSGSPSGDSKKPEIAEPLQLQEGRGGPDPSPSEISSGSSGKAVGTSGSVGSLPELERGPDCEAPGWGSGRSVHVQELES